MTTLHNIVSKTRHSEFDFCTIQQFELDAGQVLNSQMIIDEGIWHPYTIDPENETMIFLDMPSEIDLSQESFIYPTQFLEASRLLAVPYTELMALAAQVTMPENLIFIFSIGRCGSTLTHQILNQVDHLYSYSEPDVPTMLSMFRKEHAISDTTSADLIEAAMKLHLRASMPKDAKQVAFKFRAQVNPLIPCFVERFPTAKYIGMYRNPLAWARSLYRFLMIFSDEETIPQDKLPFLLRMHPDTSLTQLESYLDLTQEHFHRAEYIALSMILQLGIFEKHIKANNLFPLHYEDMLANPEKVIASLLDYCGISQTQLTQALKGLERDSQEGTGIARDFESRELDAASEALFWSVLKQHPRFGVDDFRL